MRTFAADKLKAERNKAEHGQRTDAMDRRTLTRDEALDIVRRYKQVITPRYNAVPKVYMYGSDVRKVSNLIEPVLMEDNEDSMLYREVMRTGITM